MLLSLCLLAFLPVRAWAQGIPFIRNFSATEYKAHNQNFDIITGSDGTVYVANFEGLLYYDNAQWHIIYTPGVTRITSVFRDSRGIIWTGGYNYIGYVKVDEQGRLRLFSINQQQTFQGEVQWIWEKEGRIYFKVSDERMYTVINDNVQWAAGEKLPEKGFSVFMNQSHINQVQQLDGGVKALATTGYGVIFVDEDDKEIFASQRLTACAPTMSTISPTMGMASSGEPPTMASSPSAIHPYIPALHRMRDFAARCSHWLC